ncbi:hypothetical protein ACFFMN_05245 [Planobispora siamensis]|uniref:hypothetical protein n=1 Tax=Planobispora siamensis TaxID=936338 RepID=UPI001951D813|nr:hypothetical protein [Planobispora siamensis]
MTILFVVLVVTMVGSITSEWRVAFGYEGTPGTATVVSCQPIVKGPSGKRRTYYDCKAHFVFDDPSKQPITIGTVPEAEVGDVFPAALTPDGDRVLPTGEAGRWKAAIVPLGIACGLAAMVLFGAFITRSKKVIIWACVVVMPFPVALAVAVMRGEI